MALSLKYWNGRGLAEVPRLMLAIDGKFPGDGYTDVRVTTDDIATYGEGADKVTSYNDVKDSLDINLGRLPVLQIGDVTIGQSAAINFYVAQHTNLLGSSPVETGLIISVVETVKELNTAWRDVLPYGSEPTEEYVAKWFDTPAGDVAGPAVGANRANRQLRWYAGRLEGIVGDYAVGSSLSLADVLIYYTFAEELLAKDAPADLPEWKRVPFANKAKSAEVLAAHPKLAAIAARVSAHEGVKKWHAIRGQQKF
eukprot:TRINITY_DN16703_c1_g1_i1.p1 TRINITY_DN16703_c1_g1~~TRINITY_DN16703_c1_g1_i1.p1  ORF type:complete len:268 (-),score=61.65 TRINITY_DN16703_c1_g1_i1:208-969(-)